jgi:hypothetical protein
MKKLLAIALFGILMGTSCKKETAEFTPVSNTEKATSTSEIKVSDNFDWKTTKEVSLNLIGYANAPVLIVDLNGNVIEKALLSTNAKYSTIISVPTTEKKVKLLYMGQEVILDLNQNELTYQFN